MKKNIFLFYKIISVICLTLFINCGASTTSRKISYPSAVTPAMQASFNEVERQYQKKNYDYAFAGYENFIQANEYSKLTDEAYYKQGKIFFLQSRLSDAADKFKVLADKTPNPKYRAKAQHMTAYAYYKQQDNHSAFENLKQTEAKFLPTKLQVQYYSLLYKTAKQSSDSENLNDYALLKLLDVYESFAGASLRSIRGADVVSYDETRRLIASWVAAPLLTSQIPNWMKKYEDSTPAKAYLDYKLGKTYYEGQKYSKAKKLLQQFVTRYPKNRYAEAARKMLETLGSVNIDNEKITKANFAVGVLVPLSGRHEAFGYSVLDGIKCAAGVNDICHTNYGVKLIVKDPGYSDESVREAIAELAKENVVAIIGPMSASLAVEAGIAATQNQIPIFPITQKSGIMTQGDYIFQIGMQPKDQIQAVIRAARNKGYRSFGIFHPNTNYGKTMAELFMEEARLNNCRITGLAEYNKWSKDVYAEVRKLKNSIGRVSTPDRGIGFDAIFIPDSYQNVNAIVGALEYNGLNGVALIGTTAWNDPDLSPKIAEKFPGSFFVDLYDPASSSNQVQEFTREFLAAFGRSPRVLEAYGYDIMSFIIETAASRDPKHIKESIEAGRGFNGVTGIKGFSIGDSPLIESTILKIKAQ